MSQLVTFTRADNVVTIDLGDHKVMANPDLYVSSKIGSSKVFLSKDFMSGQPVMLLSFEVTDINGRPDDNPTNVAEWLKANYFNGFDYTAFGGGWPTDYATDTNQTTNIAKVTDVETAVDNVELAVSDVEIDVEAIASKMSSGLVSEVHDNKLIVYLVAGPAIGEIDYVAFKSGVTEVARLTMGYDGSGNLITITKT
jgi:hypothetical protein